VFFILERSTYMSLFHYIASGVPLPTGERGSRRSALDKSGDNPITAIRILSSTRREGSVSLEEILGPSWFKEEQTAVYDTVADAAGIYINELPPGREAVRKHFQQPYVYALEPNMGGFHIIPEMKEHFPDEYEAHEKCIRVLLELLKETGDEHTAFEIYSCWYDEEEHPRDEKLSSVIRLSSFEIGERFELKDKQYISIVK
jgi:hypothetical protein